MGMPIYGYPAGYGVMQLDTPKPTVGQIWNWQANVDGGKTLIGNIAGSPTSQQNGAYGYWNQQVVKWQAYNQKVALYIANGGGANQLAAVGPPENYDAAMSVQLNTSPPTTVQTVPVPNCKFIGSYNPSTGISTPNTGATKYLLVWRCRGDEAIRRHRHLLGAAS